MLRFIASFLFCLLLTSAPAGFGSIFATSKKYATVGGVVAAVTQDFNNDGVSNIATANEDGGSVSVSLGRGDGSFAPANTLTVGGAIEIASGDLNREGNADLVVTDGFHAGIDLDFTVLFNTSRPR